MRARTCPMPRFGNRLKFPVEHGSISSKGGEGVKCSKCGSDKVEVQAVAETSKRGCLAALIYIALLCIPVIGWIALFKLIRGKKSRTVSYAVCQSCGRRWRI